MLFTPSSVDNVIPISICLTYLFMHTFIGNDFIYLLVKVFHKPMPFGNKNIFFLSQLISLFAIQTCYFLLEEHKKIFLFLSVFS